MRLLAIHLSDAHFGGKTHLTAERQSSIFDAIISAEHQYDAALILFTGDVANTGKPAEYDSGKELVDLLHGKLSAARQGASIRVLTVPGNHDFDDSLLGEAATTLASDIVLNEKSVAEASDTYSLLLTRQLAYWNFDESVSSFPAQTTAQKLLRVVDLSVGAAKVRAHLINTGLFSSRHEVQGQLWVPPEIYADAANPSSSYDFEIALFHHPYVWLESNNATLLRHYVEANADIAFNGHQHTPESYVVSSLSGSSTWYSAGAAVQTAKANESGFSLVVFDSAARTRRLIQFELASGVYAPTFDTGAMRVEATRSARRGFVLTEDFDSYLNDPEGLIVHTQKRNVTLQDVFEPVRLRNGINDNQKEKTSSVIVSSQLVENLPDEDIVFVFGESLSGKTCLAKTLFRQALSGDTSLVPLFANARDLLSSNKEDFDKWIRKAYRRQYDHPGFGVFSGLNKSTKLLIVDDWHSLEVNERGLTALETFVRDTFGKAVLFCDSWYQVKEVASSLDRNETKPAKNHLTILPLTALQRTRMIERWFLLGNIARQNQPNYLFDVDTAERYLDDLSRNRLLPPYPLYVLSALQTAQAVRQTEPDLGAQGVLFDILVGDKLTQISEDAPDVDLNRQFIGFLAGDVFEREKLHTLLLKGSMK